MKFMLRWIANSLAFYLALYLLDSLVAPRFRLQAVWAAVVLAIFLALFDSLIRPLHRLRSRPYRAMVVALFALLVNTLVIQAFVWTGAHVETTNPAWVLVAAMFLATLGGVINWLIGFRVKEKPGGLAREKKPPSPPGGRETRATKRPARTTRSGDRT